MLTVVGLLMGEGRSCRSWSNGQPGIKMAYRPKSTIGWATTSATFEPNPCSTTRCSVPVVDRSKQLDRGAHGEERSGHHDQQEVLDHVVVEQDVVVYAYKALDGEEGHYQSAVEGHDPLH